MAGIVPKGILPVSNGSQVSQAHLTAPYIRYDLSITYLYNGGTIQLPVAYTTGQEQDNATPPQQQAFQNRPASEVITVCKPYGRKVVRFDIIRLGIEAVAPDPTPASANEVLKVMKVKPYAPKLLSQGDQYAYRVRGKYVYDLFKPYYTSDTLSSGSTQADNSTVAGNAINQSNFIQGMI